MTLPDFSADKPLAAIVGPTASGKTKVSLSVAKMLKTEIVSADSMLIYKYMDIGTAKPTISERKDVVHHMIDILEPLQKFSVAQYQKAALDVIDSIIAKKKIPLLVGGTGLYLNSLLFPMSFTDAGFDPVVRQKLTNELIKHDSAFMHEVLNKVDPKRASEINPNDAKRIIRALEVYHVTGNPMSFYAQNYANDDPKFRMTLFGLQINRSHLYERIDRRVEKMFEEGLVDEVIKLKEIGCNESMQSMQGLGYKQILDYLEGKLTLIETKEIIKRNTRRYAKRQMTWFRSNERISWIKVEDYENEEEIANMIVKLLKDIFYF